MKEKVYRQLIKKRPFIYNLESEYYCMGYKCFRKAKNVEVTCLKQLLDECLNVKDRNVVKYDLKKYELKKLANLLCELESLIDSDVDKIERNKELINFFKTLTEEQCICIKKQIDQYEEIRNLKDRYEIM